eukprot:m.835913 g.835913  ORF g.835913 m.835913 type:complete len:229 (-) comp23455_c0_seq67:207-893(-)
MFRYKQKVALAKANSAKEEDVADTSSISPSNEQDVANSARSGVVAPSWHPTIETLRESVLAPNSALSPAAQRMRAIYYLRSIGSPEAIEILCATLKSHAVNPPHSPLLRHEIAYVLGQLQDEAACEVLESVLNDPSDNVMVRHECAEALGAIGAARSLPLLSQLAASATSDPEIQQTCEVARDFALWKATGGEESGAARPGKWRWMYTWETFLSQDMRRARRFRRGAS